MKLSTKGRYGLKAMVDLAVVYGETRLSISNLASMQGISDAYLEQLVSALKKAGLVESVRGAQGGYTLAKSPENITVNEVLKALEGETTLVDCVSSDKVDCSNACSCSARPLWLKLQSKIDEVLDSTTLKDMADDYKIQMKNISERSIHEKDIS